jgi:uncharacterized damage-inducible protein DinB
MDATALLLELYGRIPPLARAAVEGLELDRLTEAPAPGANTIAWLVWHLARVQDGNAALMLDAEQLWVSGDWAAGFGLEPDPTNSGYQHTPAEVATVRPESSETLLGYLDAVHERTCSLLAGFGAEDLERVIDPNWDPPVTVGVRLVSVADDGLQHVGQAAFVRGVFGY